MKRILLAAVTAVLVAAPAQLHAAPGDGPIPPSQTWSWQNPVFGMFDRAQLQRGFQVYKEVCAACHGLDLLSYRNLGEPGGPEFPQAQVRAIAAQYQVRALNDQGESIERPAVPSDRFRNPFPNKIAAAAANNGKAPPDLSVIVKARTYARGFPWFIGDALTGYNFLQGSNYLYAFLTGYQEPPAGTPVQEGLSYNRYFPGNWIAMPNLLQDGQVTYSDGSPQTVSQYAKDVTAFLTWAAEPKMEERKRMGLQVLIFLIVFGGLVYFTKKKVWNGVPH
jgi:cytochrome c1